MYVRDNYGDIAIRKVTFRCFHDAPYKQALSDELLSTSIDLNTLLVTT